MATGFKEIMFTPSVLEAQKTYYGRAGRAGPGQQNDALNESEQKFIRARDSFYIATVSEDGWPYVQHRGGEPGFLHILDPRTLAFADFEGNHQLLSVGYLAKNDRVTLFLMDYPNRERLKIIGHARVEDARQHPEHVEQLAKPEERPLVERLIYIDVVSYDWNCSQHITPRYTAEEVERAIAPLRQRLAELEAKLKV